MQKFMIKSARTLALTTLLLSGTSIVAANFDSQSALAQEATEQVKPKFDDGRTVPERPKQRPQLMDQRIGKRINTALEAREAGDKATAYQELDELLERRLDTYAEARIYMMKAQFLYEDDQLDQAIQHFEKALATGVEEVDYKTSDQAKNVLASLYFMKEEYQKSIDYLDQWLVYQEEIPNRAYLLRGQSLYAMQNFDEAIPEIETLIKKTQFEQGEVKENWWLLLRSMYYEKGDFKKVRDILEILVREHPKPSYWIQLAAMYSELKQEEFQLAAMEVAYQQGYFEKEAHYVNLAQLYLYNEVPYKAAMVMKDGFSNGMIEESETSLSTYAQAYQMARESKKAIEPLTKAAEMSEDGELFLRLANVYMDLDDWKSAVPALQKAIRKGDLQRLDQTYLQLGMAYFNTEELSKAKEAFEQAKKDKRSRSTANNWISYLEKEKSRRDRLAAEAKEAGLNR